MHRAWLVASFVLLAGCVTDDESNLDDQTVVDEVASEPLSLHYEGCVEHLAVVPVPMMFMAGFIPDGFTPVTFDPAGTQATFIGLAYWCNLANDTVREMLGMIQVTPPEELRSDETDMYTVIVGGFTDHELAVDTYHKWGLGDIVVSGSISMFNQAAPGVRIGTAAADDGSFNVQVDTAVAGTVGTQPAGGARAFYQGAYGLEALDAHWNESDTMTGTADVRMGGEDPGPGTAGIGVHNWADDYFIHMEKADLKTGPES